MARDEVIRLNFAQVGLFLFAKFLTEFATILERATRRNVEWTWNIARQNRDVLIFCLVGRENRLQQRLCVRMSRRIEFIAVELLHHVAEIHYGDAVTEQTHECHVVADKNVRDALFALKFDEQLDNRVLN